MFCIPGFSRTIVVMSTLGFGDIRFASDIGRAFSIMVLLSGIRAKNRSGLIPEISH
ncbi:MAG: ion channel [Smithella sp.]